MKYKIEKVAVLGSGVMGSQIAAHLANVGITSYLLDITPKELTPEEEAKGLNLQSKEVRNRIVNKGLEFAKTIKPSAFYDPSFVDRIKIGNFDDDLKVVSEVDWIIEVIIEKLEPKKELLAKVDALRKKGTIVSSNTSGIPINDICSDLSEDFKRHFLGTHFFNPPRYLKLLEIIPHEKTLPEVVEFMSEFGDKVLGKGIVKCKDTPNFIANRIGVFGIMNSIHLMMKHDLNIVEVDKLMGPVTGKPKSAMFRTSDVVGLDTMVHVAKNIYDALPNDECRETFLMPEFVNKMIENKWLGQKTKQGFYKKVDKDILYLDYKDMEYKPSPKVDFPCLQAAKQIDNLKERLASIAYSDDKGGKYFWEATIDTLIYSVNRIPEIADDILSIDNAMKWGFGWELGPFEVWDALGLEKSVERLKSEGKNVPEKIFEMLSFGYKSFYQNRNGHLFYYDFETKTYKPVHYPKGITILSSLKDQGKVIKKNASASLIDLGDGVACLEFHSKMNTLGGDIVSLLQDSLKIVEEDYEGLVIGNQGANFSVGANIMLVLMAAIEGEWDEIDLMVRAFQKAAMSIKYAKKPVVTAPFGMTLGGGVEFSIVAPRVVACSELYMGLVEVGVGVIPGGGGTKELTLRAMDKVKNTPDADPFPFLKQAFENIGMAKVSTSAYEAKNMGFLRDSDRIIVNKDRLIDEAKKSVLELVKKGYRAGQPREDIQVLGRSALSAFKLGLYTMKEGGYISDHDVLIGTKLANILCGGDLIVPRKVSEQYLLDLEREAFLSLCGTKKTQERIQHMLKTGKPLRN
ncbi:MAG: 3-hydroxyacyl-CoA dehydrogenase [Candidatus Sericytochromatia bacterium]|nr:MAG: 3-hydroxyacyl-CoA dehydrogenase [Candidatus Sericytochromatia bacterium]